MTVRSTIRRRLTTFRLRTLFVVITVFGVWFGLHLRSVKQQQISVEAFRSKGGYIFYDGDVIRPPTRLEIIQRLTVPQWLMPELGQDHFDTVIELSTYRSSGPEHFSLHSKEMLQHLSGLPRLQVLELHLTPVNDEGLRAIGKLKELRKLTLGRPKDVTDEGLRHLSQLQSLEELELYHSALTDESLEIVGELERLEILQLDGRFSEKSLQHLSGLQSLRELTLVGLEDSTLSDESVAALSSLTSLKELSLYQLQITQEGLREPVLLENLGRPDM